MKTRSGHLILDRRYDYKDIAPVFRSILKKFLSRTYASETTYDDDPQFSAVLELNLRDLRAGRKPEGWNREMGQWRLLFIENENIELCVLRRGRDKHADVSYVTGELSKLLTKNNLRHEVKWNRVSVYAQRDAANDALYLNTLSNIQQQHERGKECVYRQSITKNLIAMANLYPSIEDIMISCRKCVTDGKIYDTVSEKLHRFQSSST
jgi:hypothetical protein